VDYDPNKQGDQEGTNQSWRQRRFFRSDHQTVVRRTPQKGEESEMTKQGYCQVLLSVAVYDRLKAVATKNGLSLGKTIDGLLEYRYGIDTHVSKLDNQNLIQPPVSKTNQNQTSFLQRERLEPVGCHMAGPAGVEPATPDLEGRCALRWRWPIRAAPRAHPRLPW